MDRERRRTAVGALLLLAVATTWLALRPGRRAPEAVTADLERGARGEVAAAALDADVRRPIESTHTDPEADAAPPSSDRGSEVYRLRGRVVDAVGHPLAWADVYVAPDGLPVQAAGRTDARGRFELAWHGRADRMRVALAVRWPSGSRSPLRRLEMTAGAPLEVRVAAEDLTPYGCGNIRIPADAVTYTTASRLLDDAPAAVEPGVELARFRRPVIGAEPRMGEVRVRPGELAGFLPNADCMRESGDADYTLMPDVYEGRRRRDARGELSKDSLVVVEGRVTDLDGRPVDRAPVAVGRDEEGYDARTKTDEEGAFRIEGLPSGPLLVRAGGGTLGLDRARFDAAPGEVVRWEAALERGRELLLRVERPASAPHRRILVELQSTDPARPWHALASIFRDDTLALPHCPDQELRLLLRSPTYWTVFPFRVVDGLWPGTGERTIVLDELDFETGELRVSLADADGQPVGGAELRLWQAASGCGQWLAVRDPDGRWLHPSLPPGEYALEVVHARLGAIAADSIAITAGSATELALAFPTPGHLIVDTGGRSARLVALGAEVDARCAELAGEHELELSAGDYLVLADDPVEGAWPLTVRAGETIRLRIPAAAGIPRPRNAARGIGGAEDER